MLGAYQDADEFYPHHGRIREVKLFGQAATAEWVKEFAHNESLANEKWNEVEPSFEILVKPYLQFATKTSMTVMWQTRKKLLRLFTLVQLLPVIKKLRVMLQKFMKSLLRGLNRKHNISTG